MLKDSGCLICMLFWNFSRSWNPPCGESDGLGKFYVEILPQDALRQLMNCLQPSLLGTFDVFIVYQIWLHNSTWFIKTLCMQPTFFLPKVFTMQLNKAAYKSSDCIGMCYMKNTTMRSEQQLQTRWIRKPNITFQSVINFYKQLCFTSWVAKYPETLTAILSAVQQIIESQASHFLGLMQNCERSIWPLQCICNKHKNSYSMSKLL
jgi:hypothetical protein